MSFFEKELHSAIGENALLHGEALFVIAPADTNNVALCVCVCACVHVCVCGKGGMHTLYVCERGTPVQCM